jgi:hypothetical protein
MDKNEANWWGMASALAEQLPRLFQRGSFHSADSELQ